MVSLFDFTGVMAEPWLEAGYRCLLVDSQHPPGLTELDDGLLLLRADLRDPFVLPGGAMDGVSNVAFVTAFPPCTHLAISGARWFKGKGLRALAESVQMFATAAEFCDATEAPYMLENPVSTISTYWRKPDHTFNPCDFVGWEPEDNYTKRTCLWAGNGFVMPDQTRPPGTPAPDDRIHKAPETRRRAAMRSATPAGFARAVFAANHKAMEQ